MRILLGVCLVALAGCGSTEQPAPAPAPVVQAAPPPPPPRPVAATDSCGAVGLQRLVGRPKSEIPVPVDMSRQRVYCSSCAVTMDYRADRLNIVFDGETGLVTAVKCG